MNFTQFGIAGQLVTHRVLFLLAAWIGNNGTGDFLVIGSKGPPQYQLETGIRRLCRCHDLLYNLRLPGNVAEQVPVRYLAYLLSVRIRWHPVRDFGDGQFSYRFPLIENTPGQRRQYPGDPDCQ